ncbi:MAG: hypothetical protein GY785_09315 [Gammaproteobacteria bacterium]|nr:hypothetical protein [Gammaproteobacteria bacterium]
MVVTIPILLTAEQIEAVCSVLRQGQFIDGRLSDNASPTYQKINLCYANLFRMWAEA